MPRHLPLLAWLLASLLLLAPGLAAAVSSTANLGGSLVGSSEPSTLEGTDWTEISYDHGDGVLDIVLADADGVVQALRGDGSALPGLPVRLGVLPEVDPSHLPTPTSRHTIPGTFACKAF